MVPLADQDLPLWSRPLIAEADSFLHRASNLGTRGPRALNAAIHGVWCGRSHRADPPPWDEVLYLYDALLITRDDVVVRLNRAVALVEVAGPKAALAEIEGFDETRLETFQPWHAVRLDLLRRLGRLDESRAAYDRAILLASGRAEETGSLRAAHAFQLKSVTVSPTPGLKPPANVCRLNPRSFDPLMTSASRD